MFDRGPSVMPAVGSLVMTCLVTNEYYNEVVFQNEKKERYIFKKVL